MLKDFKEFIAKGNVIDLAVAVIIASAFGVIVASLTDEIIMPIVGTIFGGADFSNYFVLLSTPEGYEGSLTDYAALKEAGAAMIGYGAFITAIVNFVILAFIIFLLVRYAKKVMAEFEEKKEEAAPAGPTELDLLKEIRDELRAARPDYAPDKGPMG
ncbi:large conductance mechanosensitive channel protein MscL [Qipengyuania sp. 1XM1-15A]|uniref:large conductance mechanosensitive channel protein MscL n=1 Tax=Qipengyuania xiamenensis TaxID=2867237 RepID=UPI001C88BF4A|nr:large conductance mechanosensitive channel protein MscL [Qipengyuania xiamenensis]MBX7533303.1 large conductance mechanosensitive channel protein MscL [Qipengyuania xiamenensis]